MKINSLQSIRFVMAVFIFCHHFFIPQIEQFGTFPVTFFFILSGYVMSMGYDDKVTKDSFLFRNYFVSRLRRLFPLNIIGLLLACIIPIVDDISHGVFTYTKYIWIGFDILLLQSWFPFEGIYFSGNAVAWFLSDLLLCYLIFPVLLRHIKEKEGLKIILCILVCYFLIIQFIPDDQIHNFVYINPLFRAVDFVLGIALYRLFLYLKTFQIVVSSANATFIEILSLALIVVFLFIYDRIPPLYSIASFYWIPSLLFILIFTFSEKDWGGQISKLFSFKLFVYLGSLSFPIYVFHHTVICWYRTLNFDLSSQYLHSVLLLMFIILLAYLYNSLLEHKIRRFVETKYKYYEKNKCV